MINDALGDFQRQTDVSRETLDLLKQYERLLRKWTERINLVAPSTLDKLWERHFHDSLQLWELTPKRGLWVDLGSGGGFPGLVIAILAREAGQTKVVLVESDQRKAAFLRTVARELGLDAKVLSQRIEDVAPLNADVLSARALAPLPKLLAYTERHRKPGGVAVFPKGETAEDEIRDALESWHFDCQKHPSVTDAKATILSIGEVTRA